MSSLTPADQNPFWSAFAHDPRDPAFAGLRASDADRAVVTDLLAGAYADGRLSPEEHDQLQSKALALATLSQIPGLVDGLVAGPSVPEVIHARAVAMHRESLRNSLAVMLVPSVICWLVWAFTGAGDPWPLWVMLGTGIPFLLTAAGSAGAIRNHERTLSRKHWEE